jgi:REP element-mobilizing transposase RayT
MHLIHEKGFRFLGYVILPNHVHFIIRVPEEAQLNSTLSNGKRFMAYAIIERLQKAGRNDLLRRLCEGLRLTALAKG